jgi:hypothetical protein
LEFFLLASVDFERKIGIDARGDLGHVTVNVGLRDCRVCRTDVSDEVTEGDGIESFSGVIESGVVDIVNCGEMLVVCDGGDDNVGVPRFTFGKVGGASGFAGR